MKVPIKGSFTEVTSRVFDVPVKELISSAIPHLEVDDIITAMKLHLEKKFRLNDLSLPKEAEINWFYKQWEIFSFYDSHKGEDVYKTLREFNESELQYLMAIESVYHVLNN